jgi:hypothetical protein
VQLAAEVQETANSPLLRVPPGMGTAWVTQALPSQDSASATVHAERFATLEYPTAVQLAPDVQDTAVSAPPVGRAGVGSTVHAAEALVAAGHPATATTAAVITKPRANAAGFGGLTAMAAPYVLA